MELKSPTTIATDVVVLGGGGAGLKAAIEARAQGKEVLLVSSSRVGYGNNTAIAGGGFGVAAGWRDPRDSVEAHLKDTLTTGRFLNNQALAEIMIQGGVEQVSDLERFGVKFAKREGSFWITTSPGHTYPRQVMCEERLGTGITVPLRKYATKIGVRFLEGVTVTRLLKKADVAMGAIGIKASGDTYVLSAPATILATGGLGQIYYRTNNPAHITGDGYAFAYEAGLSLQDMEFIQFHATALGERGTRTVLYEPFTQRWGGAIINSLGEDIMVKYGIKDALLQTRDNVSRAAMMEILGGRCIDGCVMLDISSVPKEHLDEARSLPHLIKGIPVGQTRLLVAPTTHFCMGGVQFNEKCETSLKGLYAIGEVAGGLHGANRLGGNALLACFVFGTIAGRQAAQTARKGKCPLDKAEISSEMNRLKELGVAKGKEKVEEARLALKKAMWYNAGVVRNEPGLKKALAEVQSIRRRLNSISVGSPQELVQVMQLGNMATVAEMVIRAAMERKESRGGHYRSDYPKENNREWLANIVISRRGDEMVLSKVPVQMSRIAPKRSW